MHRYGMGEAFQHRSNLFLLSTRPKTWSPIAHVDHARQSNIVTRAGKGHLLEAWTRAAACSLAAVVASACVSLAAVEPDPVLDPNNPVVGSKLPLSKPQVNCAQYLQVMRPAPCQLVILRFNCCLLSLRGYRLSVTPVLSTFLAEAVLGPDKC